MELEPGFDPSREPVAEMAGGRAGGGRRQGHVLLAADHELGVTTGGDGDLQIALARLALGKEADGATNGMRRQQQVRAQRRQPALQG